MGFLEKAEGVYRLTEDSALFLDRRSPAYLGSAARFIGAPEMTEPFRDLTGIVRRGGPPVVENILAPGHPVWVEFAQAMAPMMRTPAQAIAEIAGDGVHKALDLACGHGLFGIAVGMKSPRARIFGLDWEPVLAVAQRNAEAAGLGERYSTIAGSALDVDLGAGYDLVLAVNFFQILSPEECESLIAKIFSCLVPGGRVITFGFIPNEDRVSPPSQAMFALSMLATTPGGDAYPFSVYSRMFGGAGFTRNDLIEIGPGQRVVVSYR
jgi:hypothetical protein